MMLILAVGVGVAAIVIFVVVVVVFCDSSFIKRSLDTLSVRMCETIDSLVPLCMLCFY